jgi:hypothetical protein
MAGKGHLPAAQHHDPGARDGVENAVHEPWSRARVLHLLLVATLVFCVPAVVGTLVESRADPQGVPGGLVASQALFVVLIVGLIVLNRRGRTLLAAWVLCGALVINGSEFFALPDLDRSLALYATPIVVAAFLIRPAGAFYILGLSIVDYVVVYARTAGDHPFNWFSLLILGGVAAAAWAAARRAAWLEEGEEMYRRELERAVAELDALELRVAALRAELEGQQPPAAARPAAQLLPGSLAAPAAAGVRLMGAEEPDAGG